MQWLEAAGSRQEVQWLGTAGSKQGVQWLEAAGSRQVVQRMESAGCRQGVQWLDAVGSRQEVQWLEAVIEVQEMYWLGETGQMCQQEAAVTVVQLADATAEEPMGETTVEEEGEGGQLPWEAATRAQPEDAASALGR